MAHCLICRPPNDFFLFPIVKQNMCGEGFGSPRETFKNTVLVTTPSRMRMCRKLKGDYFEKQKIDLYRFVWYLSQNKSGILISLFCLSNKMKKKSSKAPSTALYNCLRLPFVWKHLEIPKAQSCQNDYLSSSTYKRSFQLLVQLNNFQIFINFNFFITRNFL